jgi:signal transduction histidine kinase
MPQRPAREAAAPLGRPSHLNNCTSAVLGGELETKLPVEGHDEFADLAEDFNRMARTLKEAAAREREIEQARRDLIAAISHDLRTSLAATQALIEAVVDDVAANQETASRYLHSPLNEVPT